jgi:ubiquinone/menaquinone biosynthesis C-methylase UbiE
LLEVACGTGHHLEYLKQNFSCTGIDINQGILDVAKKKFKDITFKKADMINFNLNEEFDVITCLFSSISYVKTYANLKKTINNFSKHLKPGGIVIIEPWFTKATYTIGTPHMTIYDSKDIKIARLNISEIKGNISEMDMHYLIAEKDNDVKHFVDRHEMGLFEIDKTLQYMKEAGLSAKALKNSGKRGLFIGIKK